jgi:thiol-disulfide isomerase/thioredoxin
MGRRQRLLLWTLVGLAAIVAFAVLGLAGEHSASAGRQAPALARERLAGPPVTLPGLLAGAHGRSVLVVFWASWCTPCTREAPALEQLARSPLGRGRIAGVDWSDELSGARRYLGRYSWTFPNVRDADGTVGNAYRITGLPTSFIIDAHGRIRDVLRGPHSEEDFRRALAAA